MGSLPVAIPGSFAKGGKQPVNVPDLSRRGVASGRRRADKPSETGFRGQMMIGGWRATFPLFAAGALLYAAVVAFCIVRVGDDDLFTLLKMAIPLFGLPLLATRRRSWRLALYFLLLVPACHYLAMLAAIKSMDWRGSGFLPGVIGGSIGAALSFAVLPALALATFRRVGMMALGVIVLALLGGLGVWKMDAFSGTDLDPYGVLLTLYLPWQIVFGFFLSRLLAAPGEIGLAAAPAAA
jgi:hypothetical protein